MYWVRVTQCSNRCARMRKSTLRGCGLTICDPANSVCAACGELRHTLTRMNHARGKAGRIGTRLTAGERGPPEDVRENDTEP